MTATEMLRWIGGADIAGNLLAGLVASFLTWVVVAASTRVRRWRRAAVFIGRYHVYDMEERQVADEVLRIRWRGGSVIEVRSAGGDAAWRSLITLDENMPGVGRGVYQYESKKHTGRHEIQRSLDGRSIFVFADNPSFGTPTRALIWRKI